MSKTAVCISFFQEVGVEHYRKGKRVIVFPCFTCGQEAEMSTDDTVWSCNTGHTGTLATLIRITQQGRIRTDGGLYNPYEEKKRILNALDDIALKHGELRSEIQGLRKRVLTLIDHYERQDG